MKKVLFAVKQVAIMFGFIFLLKFLRTKKEVQQEEDLRKDHKYGSRKP